MAAHPVNDLRVTSSDSPYRIFVTHFSSSQQFPIVVGILAGR